MPSAPITTVYPTGEITRLRAQDVPQVGDEMTSNGGTWIVEEVFEMDDGSVVVTLSEPRHEVATDEEAA